MSSQANGQSIDLASILNERGDHVLLSIEGEDKAGKTTFMLSAEGPIGFQDFDHGVARAISGSPEARKKLEQPGTVYHSYSFKLPAKLNRRSDEQVLAQFKPILDKFTQDFYDLCDNKAIRTICWDSATEIWKIIQYVRSGRMEKVPYNLRPEMNAEFRGMLDAAGESGKHLILSHKVKAEWIDGPPDKNGKPTKVRSGVLVRDGFDELHYAVDAYLRCRAEVEEPTPERPDKLRFYVDFLKTGFNAKLLTGTTWESATWDTVKGLMFG